MIQRIDAVIWGLPMLILLCGTGIFLTVRTHFLPWRNLPYALRLVFGKCAHETNSTGDISPFSALMTALAATIGTGNIVGVATALVSGGPGALVWMELSALFGLSCKFAECMLAVKYRTSTPSGSMLGGPMLTIRHAFANQTLGHILSVFFSLAAIAASCGIGNMTQANAISAALHETFHILPWISGALLSFAVLMILMGGISRLSKLSAALVPAMGIFYLFCCLTVIIGHFSAIPDTIRLMFHCAFTPHAVQGGALGALTSGMMRSARFGIARGIFSNEAGMGSAAISAAAACCDDPVRQGYISMTGTFFDTILICTMTGLAICCSGVLGMTDPVTGLFVSGGALTTTAFETVLGSFGGVFLTISIVCFAFSTILGWEYHGEKALEFLVPSPHICVIYRVFYALIVFIGAVCSLDTVWNLSDIANALMAIPNLFSLLALSPVIVSEIQRYQAVIRKK